MTHPERQPIYDALDARSDVEFAALMAGLQFANRMLALSVLDDPGPCIEFAKLLAPFVAVFGEI